MSFSDSIIMGSEGSKIIKEHKQRILSIPSNVNLLSKYDELDGEQGIQVANGVYDDSGDMVYGDYYPLINDPIFDIATGTASTTYAIITASVFYFSLKIPPLLVGNDSSDTSNYIFPEAVFCTTQFGKYSQTIRDHRFIKRNLYDLNSLSLDPWVVPLEIYGPSSSPAKFEVRITLFAQNFNMAYTLEHRFWVLFELQ